MSFNNNTSILAKLGAIATPVSDAYEETYDLFSDQLPQGSLGMINDKSGSLSIETAGNRYEIRQSLGLLTSSNTEGTTGAAVWRISPLVADWLADTNNSLWSSGILHPSANIVELGCGIAGIIGCAMARQVATYILTDQSSVMKLLRENVDNNMPVLARPKGRNTKKQMMTPIQTLYITDLNWETDEANALDEVLTPDKNIDMVLVCDCVFNDFLIQPLVSMCMKLCLRNNTQETVVLFAQQLRSNEVLSSFLEQLMEQFHVWRISDSHLPATLQNGSGYVVHAAVIRCDS